MVCLFSFSSQPFKSLFVWCLAPASYLAAPIHEGNLDAGYAAPASAAWLLMPASSVHFPSRSNYASLMLQKREPLLEEKWCLNSVQRGLAAPPPSRSRAPAHPPFLWPRLRIGSSGLGVRGQGWSRCLLPSYREGSLDGGKLAVFIACG